ncbi:MAG: preprotein translocase subunit YajC [Eubacteriales bacterium]|nr:preprotein translocase subunit YajC [Eubacteriales bacterium]
MFDWLFSLPTALADEVAPAAEGAAEAGGLAATLQMFLPMILIVVVFYFLLIRPQRKKDKKVKDMLSNLKVGDRITTIGGIYGTIRALREDTITLAVGKDNVEMMFARWAIRGVEEVSIENEGELLN